jgi:predicted nuclease with TOPRIM domain
MLPMCRNLRDRIRDDLTELSEKWSDLNDTVEHGQKAEAARANKVDLKVDDLTNCQQQLYKQQQAQNAQLARLGRVAEQDRVDVSEKLDSLRDQLSAVARASNTTGR